jgi:D-3-phosphoglycerate dehydrogenase
MAERKRVLLIAPLSDPKAEELLAQACEVRHLSRPEAATLLHEVQGVHGLIAAGGLVRVTREVLARGSALRVVASIGAGFDAIDHEAATEYGIPLVNNSGVGHRPVAEHTIGLMVALAKDFRRADRVLREQGWGARNIYSRAQIGLELNELTVGIVGLGNIGKEVARKCIMAFDMRVLAYDPYVSAEEMRLRGVTKVDNLLDMLPECDFVTVHAPHNSETEHLIGAQELQAMKPSAFLLNTARGPLVNNGALVEALQAGTIAGAGIDVFEPEPPPPDHPLLALDNVLVSPHIAGVTSATTRKLAHGAARQVMQVLRGERPSRLVNPEVWEAFLQRYPPGS